MAEWFVAKASEMTDGDRRIVTAGRHEIGVFLSGGSFYAYSNQCLHQGGPLDMGPTYGHHTTAGVGEYVVDETRDVLKCPWHGYEYDVRTGSTVFDEKRCLPTFAVREDGDDIVVELGAPQNG